MAETTGQERTEAPTPRRREEARKKGQVPRSPELTSAIGLLVAAPVLALGGGSWIGQQLGGFLGTATGMLRAEPMTVAGAAALLNTTMLVLALAVVPVLGAVLAAGVAGGLVQGRGVVTAERIRPKAEHVNPLANFRRIFGLQALLTLGKSLLKLAALGLVAWMVLRDQWQLMIAAGGATPEAILALIKAMGLELAVKTGLAFLVIAGLDYGVEVWRHEQQLRMSRQEVVQEHKESEGNPLVKSRLRSLGQAMARRRMLGDVRKADVVITNPTHIAIALKYDPMAGAAPVVLAMGERKLAQRIKELAKQHGVPTVENRPLARALLATAKVGKQIPADLYAAVAEVLAWVYRRRGWRPA